MKTYLSLTLLLICFIVCAQETDYEAHEWGTFTTLSGSDGNRLNGLFVDEEPLPSFVHRISHTNSYVNGVDYKGYYVTKYEPIPLLNVNVKMETPVIYFYSKDEFSVEVDVSFPRGSISQWFPQKIDGEKSTVVDGFSNTFPEIDFLPDHNGFIKWKVGVKAANSQKNYSLKNVPHLWSAPRLPPSNHVTYNDQWRNEEESYLFYRGIGNFDIPISGFFNSEEFFTIQNTGMYGPITYFIYEKTAENIVQIYDQGTIQVNSQKVINLKEGSKRHNNFEVFKNDFTNILIDNGLTWHEAQAMLNTWNESYFQSEGFKVFWVLPRKLTDEILPISFNPAPSNLERVMIGRSEFLTPSFERILQNSSITDWEEDRYRFAYEERLTQLNDPEYTYKISELLESPCQTCSIQVYPNPTADVLNLRIFANEHANQAQLEFIDANGKVWKSVIVKLTNGFGATSTDISNLPPGVYFVRSDELGQSEQILKL